jgi:hypothetical protein
MLVHRNWGTYFADVQFEVMCVSEKTTHTTLSI